MTNAPFLGLFAHYRPVVLALPPGGRRAVAAFFGFESAEEFLVHLDGAGLLYRHQHWGRAVNQLLDVSLDQATLEGIPAMLFDWNPNAAITVEPLSLSLLQRGDGEYMEFDLRLRCGQALRAGPKSTPALMSRLREQGNLWWSTGKGDPIDDREAGSMDPEDEAAWAAIMNDSGLEAVKPSDLLIALDDFADGALDFRYSDVFLQSMATTLSMPQEYLEAWQEQGCGVIVDVGDLKIQGYC